VSEVSTVRRGTAAAGPIPVSTMTRLAPDAISMGHLPAQRSPAVSTRVHQSGGEPARLAPAHGRGLARPPPCLGPENA
jgi:hypothetical protein